MVFAECYGGVPCGSAVSEQLTELLSINNGRSEISGKGTSRHFLSQMMETAASGFA